MNLVPHLHVRQLEGWSAGVRYRLTQFQLSHPGAPGPWMPAINAYRCPEGFAICVDLAGVDQSGIEVQVEPRRLTIRGVRPAPLPADGVGPPLQVLAWEIDDGPFSREMVLPAAVDTDGVRAEHRQGLLWIILPLARADTGSGPDPGSDSLAGPGSGS